MRNSVTGTDIDYMVSPVANGCGDFFDSRNAKEGLPINADANGAYNIARKGLWLAHQIKNANDLSKVKLSITNKEWLQFAQTKPYLND
jgi:CRISPR-associated protein Cpf1